jgi:hypothetical protein
MWCGARLVCMYACMHLCMYVCDATHACIYVCNFVFDLLVSVNWVYYLLFHFDYYYHYLTLSLYLDLLFYRKFYYFVFHYNLMAKFFHLNLNQLTVIIWSYFLNSWDINHLLTFNVIQCYFFQTFQQLYFIYCYLKWLY